MRFNQKLLLALPLWAALLGTPTITLASAATETASPSAATALSQPTGNMVEQVSINSADAQTLASALNGIGLRKAQAIVEYREQYGPFTAIEQLKEVRGIGEGIFQRNQARLKL